MIGYNYHGFSNGRRLTLNKYKTYTLEFKEKVVKEYLSGGRHNELCRKYEINKTQLHRWTKQYKETGTFSDGRGRSRTGRPKSMDTSKMTKDEYIQYLEMENDILKQLSSLNKHQQK
jgi:transposase-like protein